MTPTRALATKFSHYREVAERMEPSHEALLPRSDRRRRTAMTMGVVALLDLNDWLIERFAGDTPERWDPADWPWIADIERQVPTIRQELERYLRTAPVPHVAEIAGLDPDDEETKKSAPIEVGAWRAVMLFANGAWIEETARHFPVTRSCFEDLHPKANVGFSVLEAHSHIAAHVGANRGALRLQVPIVVPGNDGDCRIRIGDEMVHWHEGEAIVFDLKVDHEAWNDADATRVLLMVEIAQPLPGPLALVNRAAQYSMRWHASYRGLPERIADLGLRHDAAASAHP